MGSKIEGSAARLGRSRLSEKFRDRRLAARLRRVGRDGLGDPKNLGIGSLAGTGRTARYRLPENLLSSARLGHIRRDGFGIPFRDRRLDRVGRDGFGLMKNLGIGGSTGTGWTKRLGWDGSGRFRRSQKFKDRRLGLDGSDGTVSAFRKN